jgi:hypothetical protein
MKLSATTEIAIMLGDSLGNTADECGVPVQGKVNLENSENDNALFWDVMLSIASILVKYISPKRRLTLNGLRGITHQKRVLVITTDVNLSTTLCLIPGTNPNPPFSDTGLKP